MGTWDLTPKQEAFCKNIALKNMNYSDAYRAAYDCKRSSDKTINNKAYVLLNRDDITARIAELKEDEKAAAVYTKAKGIKMLLEMAVEARQAAVQEIDGARIVDAKLIKASESCLAELNKMIGAYEPDVVKSVEMSFEEYIKGLDDGNKP